MSFGALVNDQGPTGSHAILLLVPSRNPCAASKRGMWEGAPKSGRMAVRWEFYYLRSCPVTKPPCGIAGAGRAA